VRGAGGGYQLGAGTALPPLMFDAEEAIATLLALRDWASGGELDTSDAALSALDKLTRVMPPRLRPALEALSAHSSSLDLGTVIGSTRPSPWPPWPCSPVPAARSGKVTCAYRRYDGQVSVRRVEPLHLVRTMGRWYLVAYCLNVGDWRTFRVDRVSDPAITRDPSGRREPPAADLHDYVTARISDGMRQVTAVVRVHAPRDEVAPLDQARVGYRHRGDAQDVHRAGGADSYAAMARWLLLLNRKPHRDPARRTPHRVRRTRREHRPRRRRRGNEPAP